MAALLPPGGIVGGRFRVQGALGRGGMGAVFRAEELGTGRPVAIKVLGGPATAERIERLRREGEITAGLNHPGIVRIHAAGAEGGLPWLAYELVESPRGLDEAVAGLDRAQRLQLLRDVAEAVGFAHARGVVHRDLKPGNVLVDGAGRARVTDFGLARGEGLEALTRTGQLVGTPSYMAPELFASPAQASPHSDVWALGVMLYELLCERLPFPAGNLVELAGQVATQDPIPPSAVDPSVPRALDAVCLQALARVPAARYPDAAALAADLARFLAGQRVQASPPRAARRGRRAALLATLLLLAVGLPLLALATSAPPAAEDRDPPSLSVSAPADGLETEDALLELVGRASDDAPGVTVCLGSGTPVAVDAGGGFRLVTALQPGGNELVLVAQDAAGNRSRPAVLKVTRRGLPAWFLTLPAQERPPEPLRPGLRPAETPREYTWDQDRSALVYVPPGTFTMGDDDPEDGPPHEVRLTRGYFIGAREVTRGQYLRFCRATGCPEPDAVTTTTVGKLATTLEGLTGMQVKPGMVLSEEHPISNVTWAQARDYCQWAGLRLPSDAEWECAARGRDGRTWPWGETAPAGLQPLANVSGPEDGELLLARTGRYPRGISPFGCLDTIGNVKEWTADQRKPYGVKPGGRRVDPAVPGPGRRMSVRGGGFDDRPRALGRRIGRAPDDPALGLGFRTALSARE